MKRRELRVAVGEHLDVDLEVEAHLVDDDHRLALERREVVGVVRRADGRVGEVVEQPARRDALRSEKNVRSRSAALSTGTCSRLNSLRRPSGIEASRKT